MRVVFLREAIKSRQGRFRRWLATQSPGVTAPSGHIEVTGVSRIDVQFIGKDPNDWIVRIALKTGRELHYDPSEEFIDDGPILHGDDLDWHRSIAIWFKEVAKELLAKEEGGE